MHFSIDIAERLLVVTISFDTYISVNCWKFQYILKIVTNDVCVSICIFERTWFVFKYRTIYYSNILVGCSFSIEIVQVENFYLKKNIYLGIL